MLKDQAQKGGEILIWFSPSEFLATGDNLTGNDGFCFLIFTQKIIMLLPTNFENLKYSDQVAFLDKTIVSSILCLKKWHN